MAFFSKPMYTSVILRSCDRCGATQTAQDTPRYQSLSYDYEVEAEHGRGTDTRESRVDLCPACVETLVTEILRRKGMLP